VSADKLAVFGVPTAAGARSPGTSRAPAALRAAGLLEALGNTSARVVNLSDLSLFPFREDEEHPQKRNAPVAACAARATADEMTRALAEGFTIVLGGDCSLVVGTVGGAREALHEPVGLVYLDANADLNTPETSPSGYLDGMALALALGDGPQELTEAGGPFPAVLPEHVSLVGFRELDEREHDRLDDLGLVLPGKVARSIGMRATAGLALDGVGNGDGPFVIHLDVDVLDHAEMPAKDYLTKGEGFSLSETQELLARLAGSPRAAALEVAEFNPDLDPGGIYAAKVVDLLAGAMARRFKP